MNGSTGTGGGGASFALLMLRVVAGLAFMVHGWVKIKDPTGWMGPDAGTPGVLQALAAVSEFGGGLAWILGALTRLASFGLLCTMSYAFWTHAVIRGDPFVPDGPGPAYELALVYWSVALLLLLVGPGRFSVDAGLFRRGRGTTGR